MAGDSDRFDRWCEQTLRPSQLGLVICECFYYGALVVWMPPLPKPLWTMVSPEFKFDCNRIREAPAPLLETWEVQVVTIYRCSVWQRISACWYQVCWCHLRRNVRASVDRNDDDEGERAGRRS